MYELPEGKQIVPFDGGGFRFMGRIDLDEPSRPVMIWPASCADTTFTGTYVAVVLKNKNFQEYTHFGAIIDGVMQKFDLKNTDEEELYVLAEGLPDRPHSLRLIKTQAAANYVTLCGLVIDGGKDISPSRSEYDMKIEVYGDSVSAGEVVEALFYEGQEDPPHHSQYDNAYFSYPMILSRLLNAEVHDIAQGGIALLDGTGWYCSDQLTGMESCYDKMQYSPYADRKQWDFSRFMPDYVIFCLGQNDANPNPLDIRKPEYRRRWKDKYEEILRDLMGKYPKAQFIIMLTILGHHQTWDDALMEIVEELDTPRVRYHRFRRCAKATNGHPRATEQQEMADELCTLIEKMHSDDI